MPELRKRGDFFAGGCCQRRLWTGLAAHWRVLFAGKISHSGLRGLRPGGMVCAVGVSRQGKGKILTRTVTLFDLMPYQVTVGKILSLLIVLGYTALAVRAGGIHGLKCSAGLLFPLALIWFPEEIGSLTGYFRSGYVNVQTPAIIVSFGGWLFLVGLPVLLYFATRHG